MTPEFDAAMMARALFWAERGRGRTSPNPMVGAVVVDARGVVVGQGAHLAAGEPHAEVVALDRAGDRARGASLYCTLEPCSHHGRTGPCVERVVAAGVRRVVVAVADRNPLVSGRGFSYLSDHGVLVTSGVGEGPAQEQLAPFFTWITRRRPFVIAKAAVSADGFVGPSGRPVRLTGPEADRHFHRQRAEIDAIVVGSGTVLTDDPRLTARGAFRHRPLVRVVIDWRGRVLANARLFSTLEAGPVIMVTTVSGRERLDAHFRALEDRGIDVRAFASRNLVDVFGWLADQSILSLLVEGGPRLHTAAFELGLVDRVQIAHTPVWLGGGVEAAPELVSQPPSGARIRQLGADRLVEFDVHRTD